MTSTETRYAQIEKELLAVLFSLEKFHQYIYGTHVDIESDHITRKLLCQAPPRLQHMLLRLQRYDYTLRYTPGKDMVIADTLSRVHIPYTPSDDLEEDLDCAVHMVLENSYATDKDLQNVRKNTETDHSLQRLQGFIRTGWPDNRADLPDHIRAYWNFREELSEADGIILKGEQIVIPVNMLLSRIHCGRMGVVKCLQ